MTALVVYPALGYNTFVDVAGATLLADDYLSHTLWEDLAVEDQQRWLLRTGDILMGYEGFAPSSPADACLPSAQVQLVLFQLANGLGGLRHETSQQLRIREMDVLKEEFFKNAGAEAYVVNNVPGSVLDCLRANGAILMDTSCGGVGTVRRTR